MDTYRDLEKIFRRIGALGDAEGILHWDMSVIMPSGGADARAEQLAALKLTTHELLTAPRMADVLDEAHMTPPTDDWQAANLREMRRNWRHATAIDAGLVEALNTASSRCEMIWRDARPDGNCAAVSGALGEVLDLVRDKAACKAEAFGVLPYEALLDQYEPGIRVTDIDHLFDDLAEFLPDILHNVMDSQESAAAPEALVGPFDLDSQRQLGIDLMSHVGFDFDHGRLDVSLHPFCGGVPDDVRITTRYNEDDFSHSLMGVLHETGHAMYERGLPEAWRFQPVGQARGMAMHESQSLLIEMQVCRGHEFLSFAAPLMRRAFGADGPAWQEDNLYRLYTSVRPGFIRVDADEVTYPAHIILRYRLERALIGGDLVLADLPAAWNDGMKELLGIVPPDDRLGCLQDVHWPGGDFGYFPTYTMGAIAAAQLYAAARRDTPDVEANIAKGEFSPLMGWLGQHVHSQGSRVAADDLLTAATGAPLDPALFEQHLRERYLN
ncbi:MAG: carboxypeptidase M32 [Alphaproteobacteria bacterium]|nr:carboxypeptidase M32 [Alphaproteobacteria bacterium]